VNVLFGRSESPLSRLEARQVQRLVAPFGVDLVEYRRPSGAYSRWFTATAQDEAEKASLAYRCQRVIEGAGLPFV